jgi:hypothetical protein
LPANSQTLLNDSVCCVPCYTLKNALILKQDYDLLKSELNISRDSINIYTKINFQKDSIIFDQRNIIKGNGDIIMIKNSILNEKDNEIIDLNKNIKHYKKQRNATIVTGVALIALTIFISR